MVLDMGAGAERTLDDLVQVAHRIGGAIESVIEGKPEAVRLALTVLLAEGHVLIEDVPGVGKTMLAKALGRSTQCAVQRIQFTPDLLPSDITGVSAFNQEHREFEFKPGPVFANIVVGDEINRASPKTQSALLECMEERQVTVDGTSYPLERPFMVVATQNPVEMEGTYPLPEAQRDRFTARISMGYPSTEAELAMLDLHGSSSPLDSLEPVASASDVRDLIAAVRRVHVAEALKQYVISLVSATRSAPELRLGAPRAPRCTCSGPAGPGRPWTAGTSSSRTTCRPWPDRSSRTACCRPPKPWWSASCRTGWWRASSSRRPLPRTDALSRMR